MAPGGNKNDGIVLTSLLCRHSPWRSSFVRMKAQIGRVRSRLGDIETHSLFLVLSRAFNPGKNTLPVFREATMFLETLSVSSLRALLPYFFIFLFFSEARRKEGSRAPFEFLWTGSRC